MEDLVKPAQALDRGLDWLVFRISWWKC